MSHVFDPSDLARIVRTTTAQFENEPLGFVLRRVTDALADAYPGQVNPNWEWTFSVDGGGNQQVAILHVSLTEYLTIVSCPVPNGGFSGRYSTTIHDFIVDGEIQQYREGELQASSFTAGDHVTLEPNQAECYAIPTSLCMIEYARGPIPTMFALPVTDTVFGTLDYRSLAKMVARAGAAMLRTYSGGYDTGWHNWMGNLTAHPAIRERPGSLDELTAAVAHAAGRGLGVRVFGSSHSWSALVPTDGVLIDMRGLDRPLPLRDGDPDGCIRVEAGMSVERMLDVAAGLGLFIPSTTVATNFSVGGLVATGSHGTGLAFATFSDNVVGMTVVTADGTVREVFADDPDLPFARVALGTLGVIYAVTIRGLPTRNVRCEDRWLPLDDGIDSITDLARTHDAVAMFWFPYTSKAWIKLWDFTDEPADFGWWDRLKVRATQFVTEGPFSWAAVRLISRHFASLMPLFLKLIVALSRDHTSVRGPRHAFHYQYEYPPCMDSSHAIPMDTAADAWRAYVAEIEAFRRRGVYPINMVVHCRFAAAGSGVLAPDRGRSSCYIEAVTYKDTPGADDYYRTMHEQMTASEFDGRPHWAKLLYDLDVLKRQYGSALDEFEQVRSRWDPDGRFLNGFLREVLPVAE